MANQSAVTLRMSLGLLLLLLLVLCGTDAKMEIIAKNDIQVGQELIIMCKAGADGEITWQKDGENIDEEKVSSLDESNSKVDIKSSTMQDAGTYTCMCEYSSGHEDQAQITVFVHDGPSFGGTKVYHEFLAGMNATVPCLATGAPAVDVHWLRDDLQIPSNAARRVRQLPDNSLLIEKVSREDAGTYTCRAQIRGRKVQKELPVSVVVNVAPTVHLKEEVKKVTTGPETNVTFLCLVNGLPPPSINWTMPVMFDPSHHIFNSDHSELTIRSVRKEDHGEYVCTATNKIAESSGIITLHVFEAPEVFLSSERQRVSVGDRVSVSCNVSGHPQPELYWLNKHNGKTVDSTSGRVRVVEGVLTIDEVVPSDGGLYSCMAVSSTGNASRDVAIYTEPGPPYYLSVAPGPASVLFSLKTSPVNGGEPITNYVLQWRQSATEQWKEILTSTALDPLVIPSLKPYTMYTVRLAAMNTVGPGQFSETRSVRTHGIQGEPESPLLHTDNMKIKANSFSVPIKQTDDGGTPLLHFNIRYKQDKKGAEWREMQVPSSAKSFSLSGLQFSSDYQLEVTAVNTNGSSIPAVFNFTIGAQPVNNRSMTKGAVVAIVMVIFLVVLLLVDASCCYINRCGLLMTIAGKLFGQKVPGRMLEEGEGTTNGEVKLKGISTPRGSLQQGGVQTITKEGHLSEVNHDKAPLTKNEKVQPRKDLPANDA